MSKMDASRKLNEILSSPEHSFLEPSTNPSEPQFKDADPISTTAHPGRGIEQHESNSGVCGINITQTSDVGIISTSQHQRYQGPHWNDQEHRPQQHHHPYLFDATTCLENHEHHHEPQEEGKHEDGEERKDQDLNDFEHHLIQQQQQNQHQPLLLQQQNECQQQQQPQQQQTQHRRQRNDIGQCGNSCSNPKLYNSKIDGITITSSDLFEESREEKHILDPGTTDLFPTPLFPKFTGDDDNRFELESNSSHSNVRKIPSPALATQKRPTFRRSKSVAAHSEDQSEISTFSSSPHLRALVRKLSDVGVSTSNSQTGRDDSYNKAKAEISLERKRSFRRDSKTTQDFQGLIFRFSSSGDKSNNYTEEHSSPPFPIPSLLPPSSSSSSLTVLSTTAISFVTAKNPYRQYTDTKSLFNQECMRNTISQLNQKTNSKSSIILEKQVNCQTYHCQQCGDGEEGTLRRKVNKDSSQLYEYQQPGEEFSQPSVSQNHIGRSWDSGNFADPNQVTNQTNIQNRGGETNKSSWSEKVKTILQQGNENNDSKTSDQPFIVDWKHKCQKQNGGKEGEGELPFSSMAIDQAEIERLLEQSLLRRRSKAGSGASFFFASSGLADRAAPSSETENGVNKYYEESTSIICKNPEQLKADKTIETVESKSDFNSNNCRYVVSIYGSCQKNENDKNNGGNKDTEVGHTLVSNESISPKLDVQPRVIQLHLDANKKPVDDSTGCQYSRFMKKNTNSSEVDGTSPRVTVKIHTSHAACTASPDGIKSTTSMNCLSSTASTNKASSQKERIAFYKEERKKQIAYLATRCNMDYSNTTRDSSPSRRSRQGKLTPDVLKKNALDSRNPVGKSITSSSYKDVEGDGIVVDNLDESKALGDFLSRSDALKVNVTVNSSTKVTIAYDENGRRVSIPVKATQRQHHHQQQLPNTKQDEEKIIKSANNSKSVLNANDNDTTEKEKESARDFLNVKDTKSLKCNQKSPVPVGFKSFTELHKFKQRLRNATLNSLSYSSIPYQPQNQKRLTSAYGSIAPTEKSFKSSKNYSKSTANVEAKKTSSDVTGTCHPKKTRHISPARSTRSEVSSEIPSPTNTSPHRREFSFKVSLPKENWDDIKETNTKDEKGVVSKMRNFSQYTSKTRKPWSRNISPRVPPRKSPRKKLVLKTGSTVEIRPPMIDRFKSVTDCDKVLTGVRHGSLKSKSSSCFTKCSANKNKISDSGGNRGIHIEKANRTEMDVSCDKVNVNTEKKVTHCGHTQHEEDKHFDEMSQKKVKHLEHAETESIVDGAMNNQLSATIKKRGSQPANDGSSLSQLDEIPSSKKRVSITEGVESMQAISRAQKHDIIKKEEEATLAKFETYITRKKQVLAEENMETNSVSSANWCPVNSDSARRVVTASTGKKLTSSPSCQLHTSDKDKQLETIDPVDTNETYTQHNDNIVRSGKEKDQASVSFESLQCQRKARPSAAVCNLTGQVRNTGNDNPIESDSTPNNEGIPIPESIRRCDFVPMVCIPLNADKENNIMVAPIDKKDNGDPASPVMQASLSVSREEHLQQDPIDNKTYVTQTKSDSLSIDVTHLIVNKDSTTVGTQLKQNDEHDVISGIEQSPESMHATKVKFNPLSDNISAYKNYETVDITLIKNTGEVDQMTIAPKSCESALERLQSPNESHMLTEKQTVNNKHETLTLYVTDDAEFQERDNIIHEKVSSFMGVTETSEITVTTANNVTGVAGTKSLQSGSGSNSKTSSSKTSIIEDSCSTVTNDFCPTPSESQIASMLEKHPIETLSKSERNSVGKQSKQIGKVINTGGADSDCELSDSLYSKMFPNSKYPYEKNNVVSNSESQYCSRLFGVNISQSQHTLSSSSDMKCEVSCPDQSQDSLKMVSLPTSETSTILTSVSKMDNVLRVPLHNMKIKDGRLSQKTEDNCMRVEQNIETTSSTITDKLSWLSNADTSDLDAPKKTNTKKLNQQLLSCKDGSIRVKKTIAQQTGFAKIQFTPEHDIKDQITSNRDMKTDTDISICHKTSNSPVTLSSANALYNEQYKSNFSVSSVLNKKVSGVGKITDTSPQQQPSYKDTSNSFDIISGQNSFGVETYSTQESTRTQNVNEKTNVSMKIDPPSSRESAEPNNEDGNRRDNFYIPEECIPNSKSAESTHIKLSNQVASRKQKPVKITTHQFDKDCRQTTHSSSRVKKCHGTNDDRCFSNSLTTPTQLLSVSSISRSNEYDNCMDGISFLTENSITHTSSLCSNNESQDLPALEKKSSDSLTELTSFKNDKDKHTSNIRPTCMNTEPPTSLECSLLYNSPPLRNTRASKIDETSALQTNMSNLNGGDYDNDDNNDGQETEVTDELSCSPCRSNNEGSETTAIIMAKESETMLKLDLQNDSANKLKATHDLPRALKSDSIISQTRVDYTTASDEVTLASVQDSDGRCLRVSVQNNAALSQRVGPDDSDCFMRQSNKAVYSEDTTSNDDCPMYLQDIITNKKGKLNQDRIVMFQGENPCNVIVAEDVKTVTRNTSFSGNTNPQKWSQSEDNAIESNSQQRLTQGYKSADTGATTTPKIDLKSSKWSPRVFRKPKGIIVASKIAEKIKGLLSMSKSGPSHYPNQNSIHFEDQVCANDIISQNLPGNQRFEEEGDAWYRDGSFAKVQLSVNKQALNSDYLTNERIGIEIFKSDLNEGSMKDDGKEIIMLQEVETKVNAREKSKETTLRDDCQDYLSKIDGDNMPSEASNYTNDLKKKNKETNTQEKLSRRQESQTINQKAKTETTMGSINTSIQHKKETLDDVEQQNKTSDDRDVMETGTSVLQNVSFPKSLLASRPFETPSESAAWQSVESPNLKNTPVSKKDTFGINCTSTLLDTSVVEIAQTADDIVSLKHIHNHVVNLQVNETTDVKEVCSEYFRHKKTECHKSELNRSNTSSFPKYTQPNEDNPFTLDECSKSNLKIKECNILDANDRDHQPFSDTLKDVINHGKIQTGNVDLAESDTLATISKLKDRAVISQFKQWKELTHENENTKDLTETILGESDTFFEPVKNTQSTLSPNEFHLSTSQVNDVENTKHQEQILEDNIVLDDSEYSICSHTRDNLSCHDLMPSTLLLLLSPSAPLPLAVQEECLFRDPEQPERREEKLKSEEEVANFDISDDSFNSVFMENALYLKEELTQSVKERAMEFKSTRASSVMTSHSRKRSFSRLKKQGSKSKNEVSEDDADCENSHIRSDVQAPTVATNASTSRLDVDEEYGDESDDDDESYSDDEDDIDDDDDDVDDIDGVDNEGHGGNDFIKRSSISRIVLSGDTCVADVEGESSDNKEKRKKKKRKDRKKMEARRRRKNLVRSSGVDGDSFAPTAEPPRSSWRDRVYSNSNGSSTDSVKQTCTNNLNDDLTNFNNNNSGSNKTYPCDGEPDVYNGVRRRSSAKTLFSDDVSGSDGGGIGSGCGSHRRKGRRLSDDNLSSAVAERLARRRASRLEEQASSSLERNDSAAASASNSNSYSISACVLPITTVVPEESDVINGRGHYSGRDTNSRTDRLMKNKNDNSKFWNCGEDNDDNANHRVSVDNNNDDDGGNHFSLDYSKSRGLSASSLLVGGTTNVSRSEERGRRERNGKACVDNSSMSMKSFKDKSIPCGGGDKMNKDDSNGGMITSAFSSRLKKLRGLEEAAEEEEECPSGISTTTAESPIPPPTIPSQDERFVKKAIERKKRKNKTATRKSALNSTLENSDDDNNEDGDDNGEHTDKDSNTVSLNGTKENNKSKVKDSKSDTDSHASVERDDDDDEEYKGGDEDSDDDHNENNGTKQSRESNMKTEDRVKKKGEGKFVSQHALLWENHAHTSTGPAPSRSKQMPDLKVLGGLSERISANRQKFDKNSSSSSSSSYCNATLSYPASSTPSQFAPATLKRVHKGRPDFDKLIKKFSSSEASESEKSDNEGGSGSTNANGVPRLNVIRRSVDANASNSSDAAENSTRRTPERSQSLRSGKLGSPSIGDEGNQMSGAAVRKSASFKSDFMSLRSSAASRNAAKGTSGANNGGVGVSCEKADTGSRKRNPFSSATSGSGSESEGNRDESGRNLRQLKSASPEIGGKGDQTTSNSSDVKTATSVVTSLSSSLSTSSLSSSITTSSKSSTTHLSDITESKETNDAQVGLEKDNRSHAPKKLVENDPVEMPKTNYKDSRNDDIASRNYKEFSPSLQSSQRSQHHSQSHSELTKTQSNAGEYSSTSATANATSSSMLSSSPSSLSASMSSIAANGNNDNYINDHNDDRAIGSNENNNDYNMSMFPSHLSSSKSTPSIPLATGGAESPSTLSSSAALSSAAISSSSTSLLSNDANSTTTTKQSCTPSPSVRRAYSFKDVSAEHSENTEQRRGILKRASSLTKKDLTAPVTPSGPLLDPQLAKILQQRRLIQGDVKEEEEDEDEDGDFDGPGSCYISERRRSRAMSAAEEIEENLKYSKERAAERGIDPEEDETFKRLSVTDRIFFMQAKIEEVKQGSGSNSRSGGTTPRSRPRSGPVTPTQQRSLDEALYGSAISAAALSPRSPTTSAMSRSPLSPLRFLPSSTTAASVSASPSPSPHSASPASTSAISSTEAASKANPIRNNNDIDEDIVDKKITRSSYTAASSVLNSKSTNSDPSQPLSISTSEFSQIADKGHNVDSVSSALSSTSSKESSSSIGRGGAVVPKLDLSDITGSASSSLSSSSKTKGLSGDQLMAKLSVIADANVAYEERRQKFQHRSRDDWRHKTQPVTLEEIEAADSLQTVASFRALVRRETSTSIIKKLQAETTTPTPIPHASAGGAKGKDAPEPFPQHLKPATTTARQQRRARKFRSNTLPITADELKAVPENTELSSDSDWEKLSPIPSLRKADSGIKLGSGDDVDISAEYANSLRSLTLEMEVEDADPSSMSVSAKTGIFKAIDDKKNKSASGAKRYINRKKRERSQTMPITEDEVKTAAEMGDDHKTSNGTMNRVHQNRLPQPEVVNRSKSVDETGQDDSEDDQLTKLSLLEKVKLFSQPKETEKVLTKPETPLVRRRSRKTASRFSTQPVTTEEVEKASAFTRISPLAMSMVKPPDPDILKGLPLKDQRQLMAQHAEMCLSQSSSRSQSRSGSLANITTSQNSSRRGSSDAGTERDGECANSNNPKGILKTDSSKDTSHPHEIQGILKSGTGSSSNTNNNSSIDTFKNSTPSSSLSSSLTSTADKTPIDNSVTNSTPSSSSSSCSSSSSFSSGITAAQPQSSSTPPQNSSSEPKSILKKAKSEEQRSDAMTSDDEDHHKSILKTTASTENEDDLDPDSQPSLGHRSRSNSQPSGILKHETASVLESGNSSSKPSRGILKAPSQERVDDSALSVKSALRQNSPDIGEKSSPSSSISSSSTSSSTATAIPLKSAMKHSNQNDDHEEVEENVTPTSQDTVFQCSSDLQKDYGYHKDDLYQSVSDRESKSLVNADNIKSNDDSNSEQMEKKNSKEEESDGEIESESSSSELLDDTPRSRMKKKRFSDRKGRRERYMSQPTESLVEEVTAVVEESHIENETVSTGKKKYKYEGRHRTQPITDDEMRDAEANTPGTNSGTLTPKSSIAERLNLLRTSGNEEWKKRVDKKDDLISTPVDIVRRREKKAASERPKSIADRLCEIEVSKKSWKGRVEESDAKRFTVAGKLAGTPAESPLVTKLKTKTNINDPQSTPKGGSMSLPFSSPSSSPATTSPTSPVKEIKEFIAKIPLPKEIVQDTNAPTESTCVASVKKSDSFKARLGRDDVENKGEEVKVEVPQVDEAFEEFFGFKNIDEITENHIPMEIDDFDDITVDPQNILTNVRKARPTRKTKSSSRNPLKNMAQTIDVKQEYTQQSHGTAEREFKRVKTENLAKDAGFAQAALAGLASKENFKQVELRRSDSNSLAHGQRLEPFNDVMLLHVKGRRSVQTRLVQPHTSSLNSGDCFILVTQDKLIQWEGQYANVIEKAKAAEIALFIQAKRDLGCKKASDVQMVTQSRDYLGGGKHLWSTLDGPKQCQDCGPDTEDELYESSMMRSNMVFRLEGNALKPYEEYWGVILKHEMLKRNEVFVFDFGTEFYLWQGKSVSMEQRKLSLRLARQLYEKGYDYTEAPINPISPLRSEENGGCPLKSEKRPNWAIFGKVNQNMETILFREKFADWPDSSRLIQCKGHEGENSNKELQEMKAFDVTKMMPLSRLPVTLKLEGADVGRGVRWSEDMQGFTKEQDIITLDVTAWHVLEYDHFKLPVSSHGQFHDGDTYVVRWQYMIANANLRSLKKGSTSHNSLTGRERCAYFFWQGNHSTINEKGASALMTVELDEERGPQVRVLEGKEPPCFLNLFGGKMILHIGKREEPSTNSQGDWRLYCLRGDYDNEMYLLEVPACVNNLRSRSSLVLLSVETSSVYVWHGVRSPTHVRKLCRRAVEHLQENIPLELGMNKNARLEVTELEEGEEGDVIWNALGKKDRDKYHSLIMNPVPTSSKTLRLYHMSSVNMMFEVHEQLSPCRTNEFTTAFPFLQLDLYTAIQPALFLVDCNHCIYLWQGWWPTSSKDHENVHTGSATARFNMDRKLAMETALNYCKEKNPSNPPTAYLVCAGIEPLAFTTLFPYWLVNEAVRELALEEGKSFGYMEDVSEVLHRVTQTRYTLAELQERPLPEGVDPLKLETYMHEKEFEECLEMTREEFYSQPAWKQKQLKQLVGLF